MQKKSKETKKKFGIEKLPYYTIQILLDSLFSRAKCSGSFSKKKMFIFILTLFSFNMSANLKANITNNLAYSLRPIKNVVLAFKFCPTKSVL